MKFERLRKPEEALAGYLELPELDRPYIKGYRSVNGRAIPVTSSKLDARDSIGGFLVRWNFGRMRYAVLPGLYATGEPNAESPVFVSANYKLSFDALRKELGGINAWILVIDTKGINVWCAAGKGTFGTRELALKIKAARLSEIVSHKRIVLPQLGAPGVSAPEIARLTGYRVVYGPVRARDIPAFLEAGMKKTADMREVRFELKDRLAVAPVEIMQSWPLALVASALALAAALPSGSHMANRFAIMFMSLLGILLSGAFLFPALLPWLPFRAFSLKGALLGLAYGAGVSILIGWSIPLAAAFTLVSASVISFMGMNFTGATTFTSPSGAAQEVTKSIVPQGLSLVAGLGLGVVAMIG